MCVSVLLQHPKSASATAQLLTKEVLPDLKVSLPLLGSNPITSVKPYPVTAARAERQLCAELQGSGAPGDTQGPGPKNQALNRSG